MNIRTGKQISLKDDDVRSTMERQLEDGIEIDEYGEQTFDFQYEGSSYVTENPDSVVAYWQGPEYEVLPKSKRWYFISVAFILGMVLFSVWTNSHIVAILFLVIGAVGFLYIIMPPRVMDYAITQDGFVVGDELHYWDEIESFWIFYEPPHTRVISLHIEGHLFPYVHVPLHELDPVDVREALLEFMPERRQERTFVDTMERLLKI